MLKLLTSHIFGVFFYQEVNAVLENIGLIWKFVLLQFYIRISNLQIQV